MVDWILVYSIFFSGIILWLIFLIIVIRGIVLLGFRKDVYRMYLYLYEYLY